MQCRRVAIFFIVHRSAGTEHPLHGGGGTGNVEDELVVPLKVFEGSQDGNGIALVSSPGTEGQITKVGETDALTSRRFVAEGVQGHACGVVLGEGF